MAPQTKEFIIDRFDFTVPSFGAQVYAGRHHGYGMVARDDECFWEYVVTRKEECKTLGFIQFS